MHDCLYFHRRKRLSSAPNMNNSSGVFQGQAVRQVGSHDANQESRHLPASRNRYVMLIMLSLVICSRLYAVYVGQGCLTAVYSPTRTPADMRPMPLKPHFGRHPRQRSSAVERSQWSSFPGRQPCKEWTRPLGPRSPVYLKPLGRVPSSPGSYRVSRPSFIPYALARFMSLILVN